MKDINIRIKKDGTIIVNTDGFTQEEIRVLISDFSDVIGKIEVISSDDDDFPNPRVEIGDNDIEKIKQKNKL